MTTAGKEVEHLDKSVSVGLKKFSFKSCISPPFGYSTRQPGGVLTTNFYKSTLEFGKDDQKTSSYLYQLYLELLRFSNKGPPKHELDEFLYQVEDASTP